MSVIWKGIVGKGFTAADFDAYAKTITFGAWRPKFVVLHNTAIPKLADWHSVPGEKRMLALEHYYRDIQKWSGGPHLFIADDLIWAFTPLNLQGVHAPSWNAISWGVELVGDYLTETLSDGVKQNAISALATLHSLVGLDPVTMHLHREDPLTTHKGCPGKNVSKPDFQGWVSARLLQIHDGEHVPGAVVA
jgi:hypothetical protein